MIKQVNCSILPADGNKRHLNILYAPLCCFRLPLVVCFYHLLICLVSFWPFYRLVGLSRLQHLMFSSAGLLGLLPLQISQLPLSGWQNSAQVSMAFIDIVESVDL